MKHPEHVGIGLALGAGLGVVVGLLLDNLALGMAIGASAGLMVGVLAAGASSIRRDGDDQD